MTVPTKKLSTSRYKKRRYQKEKIKKIQFIKCKNCGAMIVSHRLCPECGFYKGKFITNLKNTKKEKKKGKKS